MLDVEKSMLDAAPDEMGTQAATNTHLDTGMAPIEVGGCEHLRAVGEHPVPRNAPSVTIVSVKAPPPCTFECASSVKTWGAAIDPSVCTRPGTSNRPAMPPCVVLSPGNHGAGVMLTSFWARACQ